MLFFNLFLVAALVCSSTISYSAPVWTPHLPAIGSKVELTQAFAPVNVMGIAHDATQPFEFQFLVNPGAQRLSEGALKEETEKILQYFMAALTIPEKDLWVNLSPYEANRVVPTTFGSTLMGRDLLAQDYMLKQLAASLTDPSQEPGRSYWQKVNQGRAHSAKIPTITQKVWVVPAEASMIEQAKGAMIAYAHLKVMTERDYMASTVKGFIPTAITDEEKEFRQTIVPLIEKEVNEGAIFAPLRQMHHALLLAGWFKKQGLKDGLTRNYVDRSRVAGIESDETLKTDDVYAKYVASFKKGVYNFIQEDKDPLSGKIVARKYFSGGISLNAQYDVVSPDEAMMGFTGFGVKVKLNNAGLNSDKRQSALARFINRVALTFTLANQGLIAGWRVARTASLAPEVSLPAGLDNPALSFTKAFPTSAEKLNKPDGIYKYITDGDKMPIVLDLSNSQGDYVATMDRDAKGKPYYFINYNEFAIHALGYNRPEVAKAFFDNLPEVINRTAYSDFLTPAYAAYVHTMMSIRPKGLDNLFIVNTGAEALENAIKALTLNRPDAKFMLSFNRAFHGRTTGAMSITSKPIAVNGFMKFDWPKVDFPDMTPESQQASLKQVWAMLDSGESKDYPVDADIFEKAIQKLEELAAKYSGDDLRARIAELRVELDISTEHAARVGGVIVEPYQGEGGMNFTSKQFFQRLRYITALFGVPLVFDEVQSGFYVTGKIWAHDAFNLKLPPDIVTFSKKAQMGGMFVTDAYYKSIKSGQLNSTWGGSEAGIIRAVEYVKIIQRDGLEERINDLGKYALKKLREVPMGKRNEIASNPRGKGLVLALDFVSKQVRDQVAEQAFRRGLLVNAAGEKTIRILPRFDSKTYTIDEAIFILERAIDAVLRSDAAMNTVNPTGGVDFSTVNGTQPLTTNEVASTDAEVSGFIPVVVSMVNGITAQTFLKNPTTSF